VGEGFLLDEFSMGEFSAKEILHGGIFSRSNFPLKGGDFGEKMVKREKWWGEARKELSEMDFMGGGILLGKNILLTSFPQEE